MPTIFPLAPTIFLLALPRLAPVPALLAADTSVAALFRRRNRPDSDRVIELDGWTRVVPLGAVLVGVIHAVGSPAGRLVGAAFDPFDLAALAPASDRESLDEV